MKLFLDVDGVLVAWDRGAHEIHGVPYYGDEQNWPYKKGPDGWNWFKEIGMEAKDVFAPMGYEFWAGLEWTLYGKELLALAEDLFPNNVFLLTSPHRTRGCVEGRLAWIEREAPQYRSKVLVGDCKYAVASDTSILVDDFDKNVDAWAGAGGIPLLYPRPWNTQHKIKNGFRVVVEKLWELS